MKLRRFFTCLAPVALAFGLVLTGCGQAQPSSESSSPQPITGNKAAVTVYPYTFQDATGQKITLPAEPKRIVSILPSNTEILYALGLGDRVVGVTKWDDYPPEVKKKPIIGDLHPNGEAILTQKPDLVLAGVSANGKDVQALRGLGLKVAAFEPKTIQEVEETIRQVGKITNTAAKAEEVVQGMEAKVKTVTDKTKDLNPAQKPRVYVEVSPLPDLYTAGQGTFMDEMVQLAGGQNIAGDLQGWAKISAEQVIAKNPQVILSTHGATADVFKDISSRAGWSQLAAVKQRRVLAVDTNLVSRPGPRIVDGLLAFAKAIHPELFSRP